MNAPIAAFIIVLGIVVGELFLAITWNCMYCAFGLPIFVRRIDSPTGLANVSLHELGRASGTVAANPLVFRQLDANLIAFREQGFGGLFHYTPVMRGLIKHNPAESAVVVLGLVNWYVVAITVFLGVALRGGIIVVAPYLLGGFALLYLIQAVRYARVAAFLRNHPGGIPVARPNSR